MPHSSTAPLTYKRILLFWLPLAATWIMMAVEGPFLASVIARLGQTEISLAAYGAAYAFALMAEAPIIMLMSAATALVRDRLSYRRLRNFTALLNLLVTLMMVVLLLPPVFSLVVDDLVGLPPEVSAATRAALALLLPWPAAIGFRRFYQGVLIGQGETRRVAAATTLRLGTMAGIALALLATGALSGAAVGACALSGGVVAEALATRWMARSAIARMQDRSPESRAEAPSYRSISAFYLPLALTPFIALSVHPMVTFFLGQGRFPLESLAVMPVVYALTFLFRAVGLSFPEVAIALVGDRLEHYRELRTFALALGAGTALLLGAIAFTPLAPIWFERVSGLSAELARFALLPLQIMAFFPALTVLIGFQRSILVKAKRTAAVTVATVVEVLGIFSILSLLVVYSPLSGAAAASLACVLGRLLGVLVLAGPCAASRRRLQGEEVYTSAAKSAPAAAGSRG